MSCVFSSVCVCVCVVFVVLDDDDVVVLVDVVLLVDPLVVFVVWVVFAGVGLRELLVVILCARFFLRIGQAISVESKTGSPRSLTSISISSSRI
mmetsp:Transcript_13209/g.18008  ORF Transcript_13209/g.18008 Transcript_13209/m.18008 type:complete len:94 (+) Transcript_13209:186-467(+)